MLTTPCLDSANHVYQQHEHVENLEHLNGTFCLDPPDVFDLLFQEDEPVQIKVIRRRQSKGEVHRELGRADHHRVREHRGEFYYDDVRKTWIAAPSATSIMFTSRQLYAEGTRTLYSITTFSFLKTTVLCEFLEAIEDKKQYLRHIMQEATPQSKWRKHVPSSRLQSPFASLRLLVSISAEASNPTDAIASARERTSREAWSTAAPIFYVLSMLPILPKT